jgi:hypothetical protein
MAKHTRVHNAHGRLCTPSLVAALLHAGHHCFVTAPCRPPNCVSAHDVVVLPSLSGVVLLLSRSRVGMSLLSVPSPRTSRPHPCSSALCLAVAVPRCCTLLLHTPAASRHRATARTWPYVGAPAQAFMARSSTTQRAHAALPSCCLACVLAPSSPCFCRSRAAAAVLYCSPSLLCSMLFAVTMSAPPRVPLLTPPAAAAAAAP